MTDSVDDFLEHFGVRGMKWGQRKTSSSGSSSSAAKPTPSKSSKPAWQSSPHPKSALSKSSISSKKISKGESKKTKSVSKDAAEVKALFEKVKKQGKSSLSNNELKIFNARFDMEKKFSTAALELKQKKRNPATEFITKSLKTVGDRVVNKALADVADAVLAPVATKLLTGAVNKQFGKSFAKVMAKP